MGALIQDSATFAATTMSTTVQGIGPRIIGPDGGPTKTGTCPDACVLFVSMSVSALFGNNTSPPPIETPYAPSTYAFFPTFNVQTPVPEPTGCSLSILSSSNLDVPSSYPIPSTLNDQVELQLASLFASDIGVPACGTLPPTFQILVDQPTSTNMADAFNSSETSSPSLAIKAGIGVGVPLTVLVVALFARLVALRYRMRNPTIESDSNVPNYDIGFLGKSELGGQEKHFAEMKGWRTSKVEMEVTVLPAELRSTSRHELDAGLHAMELAAKTPHRLSWR